MHECLAKYEKKDTMPPTGHSTRWGVAREKVGHVMPAAGGKKELDAGQAT